MSPIKSESIFVNQGEIETNKEGRSHEKYRTVTLLDAENPSEYKFDIVDSGQKGTRIPLCDPGTGGIKGSKNPYGSVIKGYLYKNDKIVEEYIPDLEKNVDKVSKKPIVEKQTNLALDQSPIAKKKQQENSLALQELMQETHIPEVRKEIKQKKIIASITGSFGTFKGKYTDIIVDSKCLTLCYDINDPNFTPPNKLDPIEITCEGSSYQVYYSGITIEFERYGFEAQIFILQEIII